MKGDIPVTTFHGLRIFVTHVQWDELNATKNPEKKDALLDVFKKLGLNEIVTESTVWDVSQWDQKWSAEDGVYQGMLKKTPRA